MIQKKICMLGAYAVGKTSLVSRYVHSIFSDKYHTTVGVKIDKKVLDLDGQSINLVLWDLYGEDQFQRIQSFYLRGSSGYLLVMDGTRTNTLEAAVSIQQRAEEVLGQLPFVLLVNKHDLEWEVQESDLEALKQKGWAVLYTSAKTGEGVEEAFQLLAQQMLKDQ